MTDFLKVLAQSNPLATTLTDAYTVPADTSTVISSLVVSNRSATDTAFRVSVAINGAVDDLSQYIYYDIPTPGNDTFVATIGISLSEGDVVRVYATDATLSFSLFGTEIT